MIPIDAYADALPTLSPALRKLCVEMAEAPDDRCLGATVAQAFRTESPEALLVDLPCALRLGRDESYTRHVVYSDPGGAFTLVYLIWRPGQYSPVHGHRTWCGYRVLQGDLTETHYRWRDDHAAAEVCGGRVRQTGALITAQPGLDHIHRLGNDGDDVAISLHMYGVPREAIATGVNLLVAVS